MIELAEAWNVGYVWILDQINNNDFFAGFVGAGILVPIFYYLKGLIPSHRSRDAAAGAAP